MEPLTKEEIPILATACATGDSVHVTSDEMQDGVSTANMPLNQLLDQDKNVAGVTNSCYSEVPSQSRSENGQTNVPIKVPIIAPSPDLQANSEEEHGEDEEDEDEEDEDEDGNEWVTDEGEESDVEDNVELAFPKQRRESNPELPDTVTVLDALHGSKVYLVGTAHFSIESQDDVSKVIRAVQPDVVVVELCKSRINILELDEAKLLEEAKNINLEKFRLAIKQSGVVQGVMHLLLLSMSAHLTKQLGMAPGGEFRRAYHEARHVPGCRLHLGDRPIQITLKRALGALSFWQKMKLAWYLMTSKDPISKEDVEKCKQRDLLEQLLKEMTGEFPALSRVFVDERDVFLAHSLKIAARPREYHEVPEGFIPTVVVGVVGIGHVPGIVSNWDKSQDIKDIMM
ncbi:hypothetical protein C0Q70_14556 [Pomacea canaliculata]|uniref:TraB domain-containing protein n=1 Tax=Pomacea canaliculata TaxID=400727 RepID=A0A2T7NSF5_POMCA|nr:hypothetical protein C0Q70_14556 [Pomacea canaliculata]